MTQSFAHSSVIICTRNRPHDLLQCLQSLSAQTVIPIEIIVIDSSDTESLRKDTINALFPHSRCIYQHTAPGLTYQRNCGIDVATEKIIYFFDDDVILAHDYIEQMEQQFALNPTYAGGMGSVQNIPQKPSWKYQLFRRFFCLQRDYADGKFTFSGMPTHAYGTTTFKIVEVLGGCNMAFRKTTLDCHRFDETLTRYAYMEDADISRRISYEAPLFFNPHARLQHFNSPLARDAIQDNRAMFMRNYRYLFFKNIYPRNRLKIIAYAWSVLGLFLEAMIMRNTKALRGYVHGLCT